MGSSQSNISKVVMLSDKGIKDLEKDLKYPRMLQSFSRLLEIDLSRNKIKKIPDFIEEDLQKSPAVTEFLTVLNLSKNKLMRIPESIKLVFNLKVLDLSFNDITHIPESIAKVMYRLEELHIQNNAIKELPWDINNLHALKVFQCQNNIIIWLPNTLADIPTMVNLEVLPNPLNEYYASAKDPAELMTLCKIQRVPAVYMKEAVRVFEEQEQYEAGLNSEAKLLHSLLNYREGLLELEKYAVKELAAENVHCHAALRAFQRRYNSVSETRTEDLVAEAEAIFKRFFADGAPELVNMPATATGSCRAAFTDTYTYPKKINQWVFKDVYRVSFDLLVSDTFQRFRVSPVGKQLLTQLEKVEKEKRADERARVGK